MERIDPSSAIFIRYLFSEAGSEDLCLDFVNGVLAEGSSKQWPDCKPAKIEHLELQDPFDLATTNPRQEQFLFAKGRECKTQRTFHIELLLGTKILGKDEDMPENILDFWYNLFESKNEKRDRKWYDKIDPVATIAICNRVSWPQMGSFQTRLMLRERPKGSDSSDLSIGSLVMADYMHCHLIQIPKAADAKTNQRLRRWSQFFRLVGRKEQKRLRTIAAQDPLISKATEKYRQFAESPQHRQLYKQRQ